MKHNSLIYKNPQEHHIIDLSQLGTIMYAGGLIEINQPNHYFQVGDVLYYNIKDNIFSQAVAVNDIESEVCGVVSNVIDNDNFIIVSEGKIDTDRYTFEENTILYLSNVYPGKLVSIAPTDIIKQIATQTTNGIIVNIQRGYKLSQSNYSEDLEEYTKDELDEIIKNIW